MTRVDVGIGRSYITVNLEPQRPKVWNFITTVLYLCLTRMMKCDLKWGLSRGAEC